MKKYCITCVLIFLINFTNAQQTNYSRVKIWFDGKSPVELGKLGIDLTEGDYRKGVWFVSDFSSREISNIEQAGFRTEVIIPDVKSYYRDRNNFTKRSLQQTTSCISSDPDYPVPSHFYLGSMGGYFTYSQLLGILDSMALLYPNLITLKQPIDPTLSIEGNPIYYLKISDNPNVDENEPEVLYSAIHHAREPESLSQLIYYMWYLLENYSTDTNIKALVDNTEMYFVPCLNPDGYMYNEFTDPAGGGMWRKNRRDNLDGEFGVDLNRNYGYEWGYDSIGSSVLTSRETYRGTVAFSEPETQAMRNFTNSRQFRLALNYHTYGDHNIVPFGYLPDFYSPDSLQYNFYGHAITRYNNYHVGTPNQTVNYLVNGNSDDWMYGEQTSKPKIFAMTPEVGQNDDGFWPMTDRIIPLCKENMYSNLTLAKLAGHYGIVKSNVQRYVSVLSNQFYFSFQQLGLDTTGSFSVSIIPISANINSVGSPRIYTNLNSLQLLNDSISFTLSPSISPADEIHFLVEVNNGLYTDADTISLIYGMPVVIFNEDCTTIADWDTTSSSWGITTEDFVSPPTSFTDSPFSFYASNTDNKLVSTTPVSLSGLLDAKLTFFAKWNTEGQYDYVQVFASSDNGVSWTALCGNYTVAGSPAEAPGEPVYDDMRMDWVKEEMNLNDFLGQNVLFKFELKSDGFQEFDGFYFDDLQVEAIPDNTLVGEYKEKSVYLSQAIPNPASDKAIISYSNAMLGSIFTSYNSYGQIISKSKLTESSGIISLNVKDVSPGLITYFIILPDGSCSKMMKLIVL